jgi:site-specific DNA-methyltransferase (adenine-specific)
MGQAEPVFHRPDLQVTVYRADTLEVLEKLATNGSGGEFDMIFADPPYFLSNGGITCSNGKMVKVDKGKWDRSRGIQLNHDFNKTWLKKCRAVLKPNGTIWVSGTHHVIFSVGFAMQELGFKILNHIIWEKPNPPPNLSCRYFTHSTESLIWAGKDEETKHIFNYPLMRQTNRGKQMKSVWRMGDVPPDPTDLWKLPAPPKHEKVHGKHPTQKPLALVERCILASTNPGDRVLDPFMGSGTTGVACVETGRAFTGIELSDDHVELALRRIKEITSQEVFNGQNFK